MSTQEFLDSYTHRFESNKEEEMSLDEYLEFDSSLLLTTIPSYDTPNILIRVIFFISSQQKPHK